MTGPRVGFERQNGFLLRPTLIARMGYHPSLGLQGTLRKQCVTQQQSALAATAKLLKLMVVVDRAKEISMHQ